MIILNKIGTDAQKERWLQPIIDGKVRSSFAMTEPAPGSGSDPSAMQTTANKGAPGSSTGASGSSPAPAGAALYSDRPHVRRHAEGSAPLFDADQPGWEILRRIPIMGPEEHGGHCEISFDGLEIPDENRLMEVGDGLKVAQIRLGTARLTHCMRWTGMAKRAETFDYVREREAFGDALADHEGVQWLLGEAAMQIEIGRLLTMRAAVKLDLGILPARRFPWPRCWCRKPCTKRSTPRFSAVRAAVQGHTAGMDVPLRPPGAAGRRLVGNAQDGAVASPAGGRDRFLEQD